MTPPASRLSDRDRQAIDLARDLRHHIGRWLIRRGIITATLAVSPFIDPAGRPSVLIRMNACAARAILLALDEPRTAPHRQPEP